MAKSLGLFVVTFTGFKDNNSLKEQGDLNFGLIVKRIIL